MEKLTDLVEEISVQPNIQSVACILMATFSQIYGENQDQRAEKFSVSLEASTSKTEAKKGMVDREISIFKKAKYFA